MLLKKIIFLFLIISSFSHSKCLNEGLYFWPRNKNISQNSLIMIEGYATSRYIIQNIGKKYKVFLKSKTSKIYLNVIKKNKGEFNISQVILKPKKYLNPNETYELIIENLEYDTHLISRYNPKKGKNEPIIFKTKKDFDKTNPYWTKSPKILNQVYREFGCGPESKVNFSYAIKDKSEFLIKIMLKNITKKRYKEYYLSPINKKKFWIGHDMCSGQFKLIEGDNYEVKFNIIDASGNKHNSKKYKLYFTKTNQKLDNQSMFIEL